MTPHYFWPTLVVEDQYENPEEFKNIFWDNVMQYIVKGRTGENVNMIDLHLNPKFEDLYKAITKSVRQYFEQLYVEPNTYDINITKSWMNIRGESSTPRHSHSDAHYSFIYYVNTPEQYADKNIIFYANKHMSSEGFPGMFANSVTDYNALNSPIHFFPPSEGKILVFPANIAHSVDGTIDPSEEILYDNLDKLKSLRISIAGDIHLTYTAKAPRFSGIQPVSNWKKF